MNAYIIELTEMDMVLPQLIDPELSVQQKAAEVTQKLNQAKSEEEVIQIKKE